MQNLSTTILGTKIGSPNREIKTVLIRCYESLYISLTGLRQPLCCSVRACVTPEGLTLPLRCPNWACVSLAWPLLPLLGFGWTAWLLLPLLLWLAGMLKQKNHR